jgi:hypothetical protein
MYLKNIKLFKLLEKVHMVLYGKQLIVNLKRQLHLKKYFKNKNQVFDAFHNATDAQRTFR